MSARNYLLRLHVASPVHIGSGEVYEPTSFRIDTEGERPRLVAFDPADLVASLDDAGRRALEQACAGSFLEVMKVIRNLSATVPSLVEIPVAPGIAQRYKEVLGYPVGNERQVINRFTLNRTAFNPQGNLPYIPGSSLKGSLRTAQLNVINAGRMPPAGSRINARKLEENLLGGSFQTDPFRLVKVPDMQAVENLAVKILYAMNVKKRPAATPKQAPKDLTTLLETVLPGSVFEGVLRIEEPPPGAEIRAPIGADALFQAANDFYSARMHAEHSDLENVGFAERTRALEAHIESLKRSLGPRAYLVRLGRHSGAESITIEGYREIRIIKRPTPATAATTVWLASESDNPAQHESALPLGWAVLEVRDFTPAPGWWQMGYREDLRAETEHRLVSARRDRELKTQERRTRETALKEERSRLDAEERARVEEEVRRRAEWDELPEEERLVRTPALPTVTEQQVVECYNKLDALSSPLKERLAAALRDYYQRVGKWDVKPKKEKQYNKVRKIQSLLGE